VFSTSIFLTLRRSSDLFLSDEWRFLCLYLWIMMCSVISSCSSRSWLIITTVMWRVVYVAPLVLLHVSARRALAACHAYNLPSLASVVLWAYEVAHSFMMFFIRILSDDSFSLWKCLSYFVVGASAPHITFVKGITIPLIVFITSDSKAFVDNLRPPLREPATYHCWWLMVSPIGSPIYYRDPPFTDCMNRRAPLVVFPPLRRVG